MAKSLPNQIFPVPVAGGDWPLDREDDPLHPSSSSTSAPSSSPSSVQRDL